MGATISRQKQAQRGGWLGIADRFGALSGDLDRVEFATLQRRPTASDGLVCPPELCPQAEPDALPPDFAMPPRALLATLKVIALSEPHTEEFILHGENDRARFRQKSRILRLPDIIDVQVFDCGSDLSTLAIYSRSVISRIDFGANQARVIRWLAALQRTP